MEARGGQSASPPVPPPTLTTANNARVCLVGVQRVASRFATVVTAKIQEPITEGSSVLFEPEKKWTGEAELRIEDSLVQPHREGKVRLVIHNPSHESKILQDSIPVGSAQLCDNPLAVQAASEQPPDGVNIDVNVVRSQECGAHPGHA